MGMRLHRSAWLAGALILSAMLCSCTAGRALPVSDVAGGAQSNGSVSGEAPPTTQITDELIAEQKSTRDKQRDLDLDELIGTPTPYVIGPGDILSIVVWGHPELVAAAMMVQLPTVSGALPGSGAEQPPAGFVVDHNGMLQYPYIGLVKMSGLTEAQARDEIASKIATYINQPNVTLRVQAYRSKRVYVDGEVKTPGLQAINDIPMTLVEAINRAGGVLPTADQSQITVNRNGHVIRVNLPKLVQRGIDPGSLMLANGDVVRVLSRDESKVFVTGEVTAPKALTMHDGHLTLNEALGESGGINPLSGDPEQVFVVRKGPERIMVFQLDAKSTGALAMAEAFELDPKDLVYVAPTGLMRWHRNISLLLPSELSAAVGAGKQP